MDLNLMAQKILQMLGFDDFSVRLDSEERRLTIFINDNEWMKKYFGDLIKSMEHVLNLFSRKEMANNSEDLRMIFVDINNYRKQRENLIIELARAAAQKVSVTKQPVALPPMNAYERRLVHKELATRPDIKTESEGVGRERHAVVKIIA